MAKLPPSDRFPRIIRSGSVAVKIYRVTHHRTGVTYTLSWYVGGTRRTRQFNNYAVAEAEAKLKAAQLASGRIEAAETTTAEVEMLAEVKRIAGGVPVVAAMEEWARAKKLVGADLLRACEAWAAKHAGALPSCTVSEAVTKFEAAKRRQGVVWAKSYGQTMPALIAAMGDAQIATVPHDVLQTWLDGYATAVSRNTHRKRVVALWRWARKAGLLPLDTLTAAERTDATKEADRAILIVRPAELAAAFRILHASAPHYLPAFTLAALCGLRRGEVHGQDWRDIELERGFVRVTKAKPRTPARRIVPLVPAAVEWLVRYRKKEGPVCENLAIDRIRDICRTRGLDLADNGLRHGFISYRVAETGNVAETSLGAGNSPAIVHRHYRELATKDEAAAWFGTGPDVLGEQHAESACSQLAAANA